jgi:putative NIF3 family GTP cyclohydrolase 1 type 2
VKQKGEFGEYHGRRIGYWGMRGQTMSLRRFVSIVDDKLKTKSTYIDFKRKVRNVGVVSGGGWSAIHDAEELGIDTFLTGEPSHSAYTLAEEMKVNLIFAGHYATETLGVKAVGEMLKKRLGPEVEFIDHPTGL